MAEKRPVLGRNAAHVPEVWREPTDRLTGPRDQQQVVVPACVAVRHPCPAGQAKRNKLRLFCFYDRLVEVYAVELMQAVYPTPAGGASRVHGEQSYNGSRTPDIAVDSTPALGLIEIVSHHLTQRTVVEADRSAFEHDIKLMLGDKIEQLGARIQDLVDDDVAAELPGVDFARVQSIWPVIVTAGDLTQSPLLWDYIQDRVAEELRGA